MAKRRCGAEMRVGEISKKFAAEICVQKHYLHRKPPISFAFGLFLDEPNDGLGYSGPHCVGVITFGTPASRHMLIGACKQNPGAVIELNRMWVDDKMPRNTESWFLSRALALMPPRIVLSYADSAWGHDGCVYRAANFNFAGWTDMERKTPRFDYVTTKTVDGKEVEVHSREAFRNGVGLKSVRVRRRPKFKYWLVTGDRRERRELARACAWPILDWKKTNLPVTELRAAA